MKLSILMPVYNEEKTINDIVNKVLSTKFNAEIELIIVNDCSTDNTPRILTNIKDERAKIISHNVNMGKGAAIRTAIKNATGDYIVIQDADLEYNPEDINILIEETNKGYDAVFGSRFYYGRPQNEKLIHYLGNKFLTMFSNIFTGLKLTDMETCYKMVKKGLLEKITIEENRFGIEPEITSKLARIGAKITEVPIRYTARGILEGKKIGLKDAFRTIYCIIKYNLFNHRAL